jgi:acetyl-CoA carboxylase carboxyl transferase subunit beta
MNWLTNFIRPKIRSFVEPKDVPDNLWQKCPACEGMLFHRDLQENLNVCYHCGHHLKIEVAERLQLLFDEGKHRLISLPKALQDPLKFKDRKRYADRLKEARAKSKHDDAIVVASGKIGGFPAVVAAFDFNFMGGSMGTAVGEGIVVAAETAVRERAALIVIPASGGARMQEGLLSLMQMPRSIIAAKQVKEAGLPYIVLLTDPTTGGVSASFAMVGDIHIAEPGAMIGFAGKRVIQETIREELPPGFQTAEYLLAHGMVDMVVPRKQLHDTLARILDLLLNKTAKGRALKPGGFLDIGLGGKKSGGEKERGKSRAALVTDMPKKKGPVANTNATPDKAAEKPARKRAAR